MENNTEKTALRKILLEKRDMISFDLQKIAAEQIQKNLKKINSFRDAKKIGSYYPIGSEVLTQDIMQEIISKGKELYLPKLVEKNIEFRKIASFADLEKGRFDIMEPKDDCPKEDKLDVVLVPAVGITPQGVRLGYGFGYYDRFLNSNDVEAIALIVEKQVVKNIPKSEHDHIIDWTVTEDRVLRTQR